MKKIYLKSKNRWKVLFTDKNHWQCGIYIPEYASSSQITKFEKHNGPELFLLIDGEVNLVILRKNKRIEMPLKKNEIVIVNEWHNAYRPKGKKGIALVIEKDNISTKWKKG